MRSRLAELEGGELAALLADEGAKKQRREIEKKMNVNVQQISSTLDQVCGRDGWEGKDGGVWPPLSPTSPSR